MDEVGCTAGYHLLYTHVGLCSELEAGAAAGELVQVGLLIFFDMLPERHQGQQARATQPAARRLYMEAQYDGSGAGAVRGPKPGERAHCHDILACMLRAALCVAKCCVCRCVGPQTRRYRSVTTQMDLPSCPHTHVLSEQGTLFLDTLFPALAMPDIM